MNTESFVKGLQNAIADYGDDMTKAEHYFLSRVIELATNEEESRSIEDELIACIYAVACGDETDLSDEEKVLARKLYYERFETFDPPDAILEDFMKQKGLLKE